MKYERYLLHQIDWTNRLIGIKGARGAGKTVILLQHVRHNLPQDHRVLYVSLDDLYFTENKLVELADTFVKQGGKYLLLDEVHRYKNWSQELKNIYDDHADLYIIFTGSSIMHLDKARGDLSRRAVMYELFGLSFREYLYFSGNQKFDATPLDKLLNEHVEIAKIISTELRPLEHFKSYLRYGYYPYFLENTAAYPQKLAETISLALNLDLPAMYDISYTSIEKIRLLLHIISESVPFKPNITKLSERTGTTRNSLITFLKYLQEMRIVRGLYSSTRGIGLLQKPEKLYIHHPNLHFALSDEHGNIGNIRESFFISQTSTQHQVSYTRQGDFSIDGWHFEVGGKGKTMQQIKDLKNAFIAADEIEIGYQQKIPLWLFGFLY